jgi:hypothetical protein
VEIGFTCNQSIMQKVFHYLYHPNNIKKYLHVLVRGRILKVVSSEQLVTKSFDGECVIERLEVGRIRLHNE